MARFGWVAAVYVFLAGFLGAEEAPRPAPGTPCAELGAADLMICRDLDGDGKPEYVVADKQELRIYRCDSAKVPGQGRWTKVGEVGGIPAVLALAAADDGSGAAGILAVCDPDGDEVRRAARKAKQPPASRFSLRLLRKEKEGWREAAALDLPCNDGLSLQQACPDPAGKGFWISYRARDGFFVSTDAIRWDGTRLVRQADVLPPVAVADARALYPAVGEGMPRWIVGRGYLGNETVKKHEDWNPAGGYLFFQDGGRREALPCFRGVSHAVLGDIDGDGTPEILINDGWHQDYGKVARCRLACLSRQPDGSWKYALVEDVPKQFRFETLVCADLDGDGKDEVITSGQGERPGRFHPTVRYYRFRQGRWERALPDVRPGFRRRYDFDGSGKPSPGALVAVDENGDGRNDRLYQLGDEVRMLTLDGLAWSAELEKEVVTQAVDAASLAGKPAPELAVKYWVGGKGASLAELKGKVVILDFTASWCGPCRKLAPVLEEWAKELGPQGLVVLGVTAEDDKQDKAAIEKAYGKAPYPTAVSQEQLCQMAYGVSPIPHLVWIDKKGVVRGHRTGFSPEALGHLKAEISELLREP